MHQKYLSDLMFAIIKMLCKSNNIRYTVYWYEQYVHVCLCVCQKLIVTRHYERVSVRGEGLIQGDTVTSSETRLHGDTCERHLYSGIKDNRPHLLHPITEPQIFVY